MGLPFESSNKYFFVQTTKLLNSSKNIADCVALAKPERISATLWSGGIKKYGITGSDSESSLLKT